MRASQHAHEQMSRKTPTGRNKTNGRRAKVNAHLIIDILSSSIGLVELLRNLCVCVCACAFYRRAYELCLNNVYVVCCMFIEPAEHLQICATNLANIHTGTMVYRLNAHTHRVVWCLHLVSATVRRDRNEKCQRYFGDPQNAMLRKAVEVTLDTVALARPTKNLLVCHKQSGPECVPIFLLSCIDSLQ